MQSLSLVGAWLVAHRDDIAFALAVIVAIGRVLSPLAAKLAPRYPRLAHFAAAVQAAAPDVLGVVANLYRAFAGKPFGALPSVVVVESKEGESSK